MKWFQHDADASTDAKIRKLLLRHGPEGYAVYFHCLELIAGGVEKNNITFELEHDAEIIADNLKFKGDSQYSAIDKVNNILKTIIDLNLFTENDNRVFCFSLLKRLDNTISRSPEINQIKKNVGTTKQLRSNNVAEENRIEQNRIKQNKTEKNKKEYEIPSGINEGAFIEFETYRRGIRKKITKASANKLFNLLLEYDTNEQAEIINNSIMNSWQGLFPLKNKTVKQQTQTTDRPLEQTTDFSFGQDIKL